MTDAPRRTIRVTREQIENARALIRISGGEDNVEPVVVKIANARPAATTRAGDERSGAEAS